MTIYNTNEFVQSHFLDGVLIVRYINKMATDRGGGEVDGRDGDNCKPYWSRVEIPTWMHFFFTNFCTNSYKRIHTIVIQIVQYEFVHGVVFVPIHTFFIRIIVRIHTTSRERAARARGAHLLPRPGYRWQKLLVGKNCSRLTTSNNLLPKLALEPWRPSIP
jgi:hypothetical protein